MNDDAAIHPHGDLVWGTATNKRMTTNAGKVEMGNFRWTVVWEHQGGKWLIYHEHVSAPFSSLRTGPQRGVTFGMRKHNQTRSGILSRQTPISSFETSQMKQTKMKTTALTMRTMTKKMTTDYFRMTSRQWGHVARMSHSQSPGRS